MKIGEKYFFEKNSILLKNEFVESTPNYKQKVLKIQFYSEFCFNSKIEEFEKVQVELM